MRFSPLIPDRDTLFEYIVLLLVCHAICFPPSLFTISFPPKLPYCYPCNYHPTDCRDNFSVCQCSSPQRFQHKSGAKVAKALVMGIDELFEEVEDGI